MALFVLFYAFRNDLRQIFITLRRNDAFRVIICFLFTGVHDCFDLFLITFTDRYQFIDLFIPLK